MMKTAIGSSFSPSRPPPVVSTLEARITITIPLDSQPLDDNNAAWAAWDEVIAVMEKAGAALAKTLLLLLLMLLSISFPAGLIFISKSIASAARWVSPRGS